jgi:Acyl-CoA carboxylase epsilon subunit
VTSSTNPDLANLGHGPTASETPSEPDIIVVSGNPEDREMAALTAVLGGVLEELAAERGRRELAGPSAWQRSQRSLRKPMHSGPGEWRSFSG